MGGIKADEKLNTSTSIIQGNENIIIQNIKDSPITINKESGIIKQVFPILEFIRKWESKTHATATTLQTLFTGRKKELSEITEYLSKHDILVLEGEPGVGKTRVALEVLHSLEKQGYEAYCVDLLGSELYGELSTRLSVNKNNIVLIDDINRFPSHLKEILSFLEAWKATTNAKELKLLFTLRAYALEELSSIFALNGHKMANYHISILEDKDIEYLVKSAPFLISNDVFVQRIIEIAKGNARFALMAASLAVEKQKLGELYNLVDLYTDYYAHIRFLVPHAQETLAIVALFGAVEYAEDSLQEALKLANISLGNFKVACQELIHNELLDQFEGKAVRISDENLQVYFFYKVFLSSDRSLDFLSYLNVFYNNPSYPNELDKLISNSWSSFKEVQPIITQTLKEYEQ